MSAPPPTLSGTTSDTGTTTRRALPSARGNTHSSDTGNTRNTRKRPAPLPAGEKKKRGRPTKQTTDSIHVPADLKVLQSNIERIIMKLYHSTTAMSKDFYTVFTDFQENMANIELDTTGAKEQRTKHVADFKAALLARRRFFEEIGFSEYGSETMEERKYTDDEIIRVNKRKPDSGWPRPDFLPPPDKSGPARGHNSDIDQDAPKLVKNILAIVEEIKLDHISKDVDGKDKDNFETKCTKLKQAFKIQVQKKDKEMDRHQKFNMYKSLADLRSRYFVLFNDFLAKSIEAGFKEEDSLSLKDTRCTPEQIALLTGKNREAFGKAFANASIREEDVEAQNLKKEEARKGEKKEGEVTKGEEGQGKGEGKRGHA